MIVKNQTNLKVHFAGSDNSMPHMIAADLADVKYALFTCYPFIKSKKLDSDFRPADSNKFVPKLIESKRNHVIMDSGLFTLMFGADKGKKQTVKSLEEWQDKTAQFVYQNGLQCTCVEIDCQKILGVEEAWYFRNRMKQVMPNNRHINVFHLEDGKKGLDRLIEFTDYIAISVPELRIHKRKTYREDVHKLACYIKNRKPEIDIHLLGCTEKKMLEQNSFCTTADSTSWLSGNRFGRVGGSKYHVSQIKPNVRKKYAPIIKDIFIKHGIEPKQTTIKYTIDATISAMLCKREYEKACGNQD